MLFFLLNFYLNIMNDFLLKIMLINSFFFQNFDCYCCIMVVNFNFFAYFISYFKPFAYFIPYFTITYLPYYYYFHYYINYCTTISFILKY